MLEELHTMWDDHLERLGQTKHRTESTDPQVLPVHVEPYRSEPKARDF